MKNNSLGSWWYKSPDRFSFGALFPTLLGQEGMWVCQQAAQLSPPQEIGDQRIDFFIICLLRFFFFFFLSSLYYIICLARLFCKSFSFDLCASPSLYLNVSYIYYLRLSETEKIMLDNYIVFFLTINF